MHVSPLRKTPTPSILCNEHFMIFVNLLENVWGPKCHWSTTMHASLLTSTKVGAGHEPFAFKSIFCLSCSALWCEGQTAENYLPQALGTTDNREVQLMRGTGGWPRSRGKDKWRHFLPLCVSGDLRGCASVLSMLPAPWQTSLPWCRLSLGSLHWAAAFCW